MDADGAADADTETVVPGDVFTMTWVLVVVADTAVQATATMVALCCWRCAANLYGAKMRVMPAVRGIQCPVSWKLPDPASVSPVSGILPVVPPLPGLPGVLLTGALPVTDIGVAWLGNAEPSALTGADSVTAPWLPVECGWVAASCQGTRLAVVLEVPTVIVQLYGCVLPAAVAATATWTVAVDEVVHVSGAFVVPVIGVSMIICGTVTAGATVPAAPAAAVPVAAAPVAAVPVAAVAAMETVPVAVTDGSHISPPAAGVW